MKLVLQSSVLLALAWLSASCRQAEAPKPAPAQVQHSNAVAVVAGTVISADALATELKRQFRQAPAGGVTAEQKLAALENLVRQEAVYAKAKASGFDQSPEIRARIRNLIIAQFKEQQFPRTNTAVSEPEIEAFYEANGGRYAQAGAVRGAAIFLRASHTATPEKKAEARQRAEAVLGQARAAADEQAFAQVVARHSEDQASRYRGGDLGWLAREGAGVETALVEALLALAKPGEFAPLVETSSGFYVAKLLEKRDAGPKPLAEVKEAIRYQLSRQKAEQAERDFYAAMKGGLDIQINRALLDSISLPSEKNEPPRLPGADTAQK